MYFDPFPFYDIVDQAGNNIGITLQAYVYVISQHANVMVLLYLLAESVNSSLGKLINKLFIVEILSLIDFFLIYEHSFCRVLGYGIEFTDIKIILYAYFILTWRQEK